MSMVKCFLWTASVLAGSILMVCVLAGCGASGESGYPREESDYLAKLEIYEAGNDTLLKTIEDEETLYQYSQLLSWSGLESEDYELELEDYESESGELKEKTTGAKETYRIAVYRHPAAKFGDKEPKKLLTMTLYENTDITKITVEDDSIKIFFLPEEFLTFYFKISEEEREFYMQHL